MPTPSGEIPKRKTLDELVAQYRDFGLTDTHNHDASGDAYWRMIGTWERDAVRRVVLFGDVSEPSAMDTDENAWNAYVQHPDLFIPYFSGIDLHDKSSLEHVRSMLERGYFGLGEIAGASSYSPMVSKVAWKANDPMDGYLPQIYELCAEYKVPILLHIDPPNGEPVSKLEQALDAYPNTIFIFGHINTYNSPENIDRLMGAHPNLYADFFAGFTDLSPDSGNTLKDFIPVMKKYSDRFLLSTDSGYGLQSEEAAVESMYRVIDLIDDPVVARRIAHDNFDAIIQAEPASKTQLEAIRKLNLTGDQAPDMSHLTKFEAGKILIDHSVDMSSG
ncbi:amidohydrolase family protein [Cohnella caldifontis]|uniref:amidohydrolase family protein n=1 Tax=Cohnella caldifontis TaxID=3027471 RepID=UPI0023EB4896|nr:amidohydrolase family protein [Cohnella sp. YIM B05605]